MFRVAEYGLSKFKGSKYQNKDLATAQQHWRRDGASFLYKQRTTVLKRLYV